MGTAWRLANGGPTLNSVLDTQILRYSEISVMLMLLDRMESCSVLFRVKLPKKY